MHLTGKHVFLLILSLCAGFFVWYPITDTDIWWHLASAQEMIRQKRFLFHDPFCFTPKQPVWINVHWLFQLVCFGVFRVAGPYGIVAAKCLCICIVSFLLSTVWKNSQYSLLCCTFYALTCFEARYLILERPTLCTMVCMALYLWILERNRMKELALNDSKDTFLWFIPLLQIFWTNVQGLSGLGIVIIGCFMVEKVYRDRFLYRRKTGETLGNYLVVSLRQHGVFRIGVLTCLASLVNPNVYHTVIIWLKLFGRIIPQQDNIFSRSISENVPLYALSGSDVHLQVCVGSFVILFSIAAYRNKWHVSLCHVLLFILFLFLAVIAQRNIPLFYVVAVPLTLYYVTNPSGIEKPHRNTNRVQYAEIKIIGTVLLGALFCVCLYSSVLSLSFYRLTNGISPFRIPQGSIQYLRENPVDGNCFSVDRFGGYLSWNLYPQVKTFIDGRFILKTSDFFRRYLDVLTNPFCFEQVCTEYRITYAVLPLGSFYLYKPLLKHCAQSLDWKCVFVDGESAVFVSTVLSQNARIDITKKAVVDSIEQSIQKRWSNNAFVKQQFLTHFRAFAALSSFE